MSFNLLVSLHWLSILVMTINESIILATYNENPGEFIGKQTRKSCIQSKRTFETDWSHTIWASQFNWIWIMRNRWGTNRWWIKRLQEVIGERERRGRHILDRCRIGENGIGLNLRQMGWRRDWAWGIYLRWCTGKWVTQATTLSTWFKFEQS